MMRRTRRATLLVAFALLASAATAHADEIWELWARKDYDAGLTRGWRTVATFTAREECMTVLRQHFREVSGGQPMPARDAERGSFLFVAPDGSAATAMRCVPDTVDPRGPKGK